MLDAPYYNNSRINNLDESIAILRSPSKYLMWLAARRPS